MAPRPTPKKAGDLTGRRLADAQASAQDEAEDRSQQLAMARAANKDALDNGVYDPSGRRLNVEEIGDDVEDRTVFQLDTTETVEEVGTVDLQGEPEVVVRIADNVKFPLGHEPDGVNFQWLDLKGGQKYKLPISTVDYLDEKGLVWH